MPQCVSEALLMWNKVYYDKIRKGSEDTWQRQPASLLDQSCGDQQHSTLRNRHRDLAGKRVGRDTRRPCDGVTDEAIAAPQRGGGLRRTDPRYGVLSITPARLHHMAVLSYHTSGTGAPMSRGGPPSPAAQFSL
ncbi:unnamed protein product [Gadus morhua 'NCC']